MSNLGGGDAQLFEDSFTVTAHDQSKYDRVARISATSIDNQTQMQLDINTELFHVPVGVNLHVVLATSLAIDGSREDDDNNAAEDGAGRPGQPQGTAAAAAAAKGWRYVRGESNLADMFDYVCHGKIYKFEDGVDGMTIRAYISFGGLLMMLEGPYKKLTPLHVDNTYLLIKK